MCHHPQGHKSPSGLEPSTCAVFLRIPQGHSEPSVLVDVFVMRVNDSAITEAACSSRVSALPPAAAHAATNLASTP